MKPNHGKIEALDYFDGHSLLKTNQFGHLGCHAKDEMYVVPITYIYNEGYLYCHSKPGRKIEIMRKNPEICIQVEDVTDFYHWKSVIAWGRFEELAGDEAALAMRLMIKTIGETEHAKRVSSLEVDMEAEMESRILFRMKVDKSTARHEDSEPTQPESQVGDPSVKKDFTRMA